MQRFSLRWFAFCLIGLAVNWCAPSAVADGIKIDFLLDREPEVSPQPITWVLHPDLLPLWRQALARPESELKRQAAEAIVAAHRFGHVEMLTTVPDLLKVLSDEGLHPAARYAAAHALIVLDNRDSAAQLLEASQTGGKDLRQLIEPTLGRWSYDPILPVWRQRLVSPRGPRRELVLAIEGLGIRRDADSLESLLTLAMSVENSGDVRLAAARAAGQVADHGLEQRAEPLTTRSILDRLCAAALIARHRSEQAIKLNQLLGADVEPTVAGAALRSLYAIDPNLVVPLLNSTLQNADANIRRIGIETALMLPTVERVQLLSALLNDPHPGLRSQVRDGFFALSKTQELNGVIRQSTIAVLGGDDWRGQEQGAMLLGALDEESAAPRLLGLLDATRSEVSVASAWALKSLAVPETAAPVRDYVQRQTTSEELVTPSRDHQLAHLMELLGTLKYAAAIPLLEIYIPKTDRYGVNSRSCAIWALGVIQEGQPNERLAKKLMERYADTNSLPPEVFEVRRAAVLTLGRLRAKPELAVLKRLLGEAVDQELMELSIRWALQQNSDDGPPVVGPIHLERRGWFLEPGLTNP